MSPFPCADPPTKASLAEARIQATEQRGRVNALNDKIKEAEAELARLVQQSRSAIHEMEVERAAAEDRLAHMLDYLSPIRRLPDELLNQIFTLVFEDFPCCAWVLSAVSTSWRRRVLATPKLWSRIRLVTTPSSSADTVRLWLERSGSSIPLDIEIFLHSPAPPSSETSPTRGRRTAGVAHNAAAWGPDAAWEEWGQALNDPDVGTPPPPGHLHVYPAAVFALPAHPPTPITPPGYGHDIILPSYGWRSGSQQTKSRTSMHWGHIAFFYLTQQMHRWERFVFRFDRRFGSVDALKSIVADAPLLREFEVSCAEPGFFPTSDWTWLPSGKGDYPVDLSALESLTLQYVPYKWSSPMFQNLRVLSLRALPNNPHGVDRLLHILSCNPNLESLSIHASSCNSAILPLSHVTLDNLKTLSVGGHYMLANLVDCLIVPALENLAVDIDARDPVDEIIINLLARSNTPKIARLSLSYSMNGGTTGGLYYAGPGSIVTTWGFLGDMDQLEALHVGASPLDPLIQALDCPDDGQEWMCPMLTQLSLRSCPTHTSDGVSKFVRMIEARNPAGGAAPVHAPGPQPVKLQHLEFYDCASLGHDVVCWLEERIGDVRYTEASVDRRLF